MAAMSPIFDVWTERFWISILPSYLTVSFNSNQIVVQRMLEVLKA